MTPLLDNRWTGHFGIARFGAEVVSRLPAEWRRIDRGSPWLPLGGGLRDLRYSPGFNVSLHQRQLLTVHDLIHLDDAAESTAKKTFYYESVLRPAIKRMRVVHTVSEHSRRRIQEWLRDDRIDVVNVGNSVDTDVFGRDVPRPTPGKLLYVGNLKPHKNAAVLWDALRHRPDYHLTVVTSDADRARAWSEQAGLTERVDVRSSVDDEQLASLYASSSGLVFPSLHEGFGLPALEARASGVPVAFASACAVVAETVGAHGVPVEDASSPEAWAEGFDELQKGEWGNTFANGPVMRTWSDVAAAVQHSIERELGV
ncbi:glycosyl transferase family 1 [Curtobacterium sp. PhB78]|nr:glycosyl transferase family 1 [Curtobacterium sp. PhB78]